MNHLVHFPNSMMSMQVRQQKNNRFESGLFNLCSSTKNIDPSSPSSNDTGPQRRRHLTYHWYSWGVPSLHAEDVLVCFSCIGWARWRQDDNPSHQPEQPHVHARGQHHHGTLSHSNTTPGSKHHAHASGTPELDHQVHRRGGNGDQPTVREPWHGSFKVVPDTRDMQWAR